MAVALTYGATAESGSSLFRNETAWPKRRTARARLRDLPARRPNVRRGRAAPHGVRRKGGHRDVPYPVPSAVLPGRRGRRTTVHPAGLSRIRRSAGPRGRTATTLLATRGDYEETRWHRPSGPRSSRRSRRPPAKGTSRSSASRGECERAGAASVTCSEGDLESREPTSSSRRGEQGRNEDRERHVRINRELRDDRR